MRRSIEQAKVGDRVSVTHLKSGGYWNDVIPGIFLGMTQEGRVRVKILRVPHGQWRSGPIRMIRTYLPENVILEHTGEV